MIIYLIISIASLVLLLYITLSEKRKPEKIVEPIEEEKPKKVAKETIKIKAKKDSVNKEEALKN